MNELRELLERLNKMERRIGALERQAQPIVISSGVPTAPGDFNVTGDIDVNDLVASGVVTAGAYLSASGVTYPRLRMIEHTLAAGTEVQLGHTASIFGFVFISCASSGQGAIFFCRGGANTVQEIADPGGEFSAAAGGSIHNIYYNGTLSRYSLQNSHPTLARSYEITFLAR